MKSFTFRGVIVLFVQDWWRSREWSALWIGLPALILGLGLVILIAFAQLKSPLDRSRRYLTAARQSAQLGKTEAAEIFYKKALAEQPDDFDALIEAAVIADQMEDWTRRDAILRRLVEEANPSGMLFQAQVLMRGRGTEESIEQARDLMDRTLAAIGGEEGKAASFVGHLDEVRRSLARVYMQRRKLPEAVEQWKGIANPRWDDLVDLAMTYLAMGVPVEAKAIATNLLAASPPPDDGPSHARRAVVHALLGEGPEAFRQLHLARGLMKEKAELRAWADASVRCFHVLRVISSETPSLVWLEQALVISAILPSISNELLTVSGFGAVPTEGVVEPSTLVDALAGGKVPVAAHLIAGLVALRDGDVKGAAVHFSVSKEFYPATGLVLTQCGALMVRRGEVYHQMAEKLGEMGVRFTGGDVGVKLGHGKILLAIGRWEAAVEWLAPLAEENAELVGPLLELAKSKLEGTR